MEWIFFRHDSLTKYVTYLVYNEPTILICFYSSVLWNIINSPDRWTLNFLSNFFFFFFFSFFVGIIMESTYVFRKRHYFLFKYVLLVNFFSVCDVWRLVCGVFRFYYDSVLYARLFIFDRKKKLRNIVAFFYPFVFYFLWSLFVFFCSPLFFSVYTFSAVFVYK